MSEFSELLSYHVYSKKINITRLAENCNIKHSTFHQYLNGKRPLRKAEDLEKIMAYLQLSPSDRAAILDAFEISKIGPEEYNARKKAAWFMESLPEIERRRETPIAQPSFTIARTCNSATVLHGEADVSGALYAAVTEACRQSQEVWIFLQPESSLLPGLFTLLGNLSTQGVVHHLFCLENNQSMISAANVERAYRVVQYSTYATRYQPMFYYGRPEERFGSIGVMPGLVLTSSAVLLISQDGTSGILLHDQEILSCYQEQLTRVAGQCHPLLVCEETAMSMAQHPELLALLDCSHARFLIGGICSASFWTPEIIRRYLNPQLEGYEQVLAAVIETFSRAGAMRRAGCSTVLMNEESLVEFARTGSIPEFPDGFMDRPVDKNDRRFLLEQLRLANREGWYRIRFLKNIPFPLKTHWEIGILGDNMVVVSLCGKASTRELYFQEPGLCRIFQDYFDSLAEGRYATTADESDSILFRILEQELS